jgi:hypothetical protein
MEDWEQYFVEMPLRWGGDLTDPRLYPPDSWTAPGATAAARFIDGTYAATEIIFTPAHVLWRHWREARGYYPRDARPWMSNQGAWPKDRFLLLVRAFQRNRDNPAPLDGPQFATLAKDLLTTYLNSINYAPLRTGPLVDIVPTRIRRLLQLEGDA